LARHRWRTEVRRYEGKVKGDTKGHGCPVPKRGTGRYKFNSNVNGAHLKAAAA
jgi:hypothetical protein